MDSTCTDTTFITQDSLNSGLSFIGYSKSIRLYSYSDYITKSYLHNLEIKNNKWGKGLGLVESSFAFKRSGLIEGQTS